MAVASKTNQRIGSTCLFRKPAIYDSCLSVWLSDVVRYEGMAGDERVLKRKRKERMRRRRSYCTDVDGVAGGLLAPNGN